MIVQTKSWDTIETGPAQTTQQVRMRFLEADILFDAGSAQFVVNDIPAVKNGTILKAEMAENAIEAATISKALLD